MPNATRPQPPSVRPAGPPPPPPSRAPAPVPAPALAALLSVLAVCGGDAVARVFPFGPRHRAVNDLANQFVPFHAHLWDLLHGRADGGLLLDWQSGWGTSFLPDYGTYLSSPFAPLVALFPRGDIEYAVYGITVLKTAVAAAAMTFLLRRTGPEGRWWWAAVLGASYALCGWSLAEGTYNTMWLDGLIAFPLLCLVGEWVREGRRPLLGPLVVAVCWLANFYTAYMATLGAALVLLVRLAVTDSFRWRPLLRAALTTVLGTGLAAPVLVPVLLGSRHAHPGVVRDFAPAAGTDFLARLLPVTYSFATPAAFVCTAVPLLAGALLFRRDAPGRERWLWGGLCAAVALSMQWGPTHLVWHVFATPNGSPYRQTFVLSGVLVLAAWTGLARGLPDRRSLLGGAAVVLALTAGALPSPLLTPWSLLLAGVGLAAVAGALLLPGRGRYGVLAALLVTGTLVGQAAATTAHADRERLARLDDYPPWGAEHERRAAALAAADGWPAYRTDSGLPRVAGNDPLLLGGQGAAYYSSHTPAVLTETLAALGGGWTSRGRNLLSLDNPVTDALFGVGARWRDGEVVRTDAHLPLVTVRPPGPPPVYGPSPFRNQELLLGARVYEPPHAGACRVGTEVFLWSPDATGTAVLGARKTHLLGGGPKRRAALTSLGVQRVPGLKPDLPAPGELGCLDHGRLRAAVTALRARAATSVRVTSSGIRATLPPGATGTAVVAAPHIAGWHCDGADPTSYGGLLAVPAGNGELSCAFRPPGLRAGLAAGALAALGLAGVAVAGRRPRQDRAIASPTAAPVGGTTSAVSRSADGR
ncbi:membrane protein YfhO [Streptomyces sp. PanSC19]|uniref:YfhO family protein n=1 Tax=Streptomyces sp. PanSC19 TaxID=1520455 RepID=UPI000F495B0A|nr:YfhO family protein [Streptomyces sp. PanSC19]ROQ24673.1 membrane protein YfhO [Streptomyces sp. PanSC19]